MVGYLLNELLPRLVEPRDYIVSRLGLTAFGILSMTAKLQGLVNVRCQLAEVIRVHYRSTIDRLDRTSWYYAGEMIGTPESGRAAAIGAFSHDSGTWSVARALWYMPEGNSQSRCLVRARVQTGPAAKWHDLQLKRADKTVATYSAMNTIIEAIEGSKLRVQLGCKKRSPADSGWA